MNFTFNTEFTASTLLERTFGLIASFGLMPNGFKMVLGRLELNYVEQNGHQTTKLRMLRAHQKPAATLGVQCESTVIIQKVVALGYGVRYSFPPIPIRKNQAST